MSDVLSSIDALHVGVQDGESPLDLAERVTDNILVRPAAVLTHVDVRRAELTPRMRVAGRTTRTTRSSATTWGWKDMRRR
eukprot:2690068-Rhodomonas_salina.2